MSARWAMVCGTAIAVALALGGCATVAPWERERLAHPAMRPGTETERAEFDAHIAGARESALDPGAAGGGGCGCN